MSYEVHGRVRVVRNDAHGGMRGGSDEREGGLRVSGDKVANRVRRCHVVRFVVSRAQ